MTAPSLTAAESRTHKAKTERGGCGPHCGPRDRAIFPEIPVNIAVHHEKVQSLWDRYNQRVALPVAVSHALTAFFQFFFMIGLAILVLPFDSSPEK